MTMDNLPEEIIELILNYADADRASLRAFTSISRVFVPIAQRRFFSSIAFHSKEDDPSSTSRRLTQLVEILEESPHLLSYTTRVAYLVPTGIEDCTDGLRREGDLLERIIPLMTRLQSVSIRFYLGASTWKPQLTHWGSIPPPLQHALQGLLSLPELVAVHCQDIGSLPFSIIPWTSLTTICLNNVSVDSSSDGDTASPPQNYPSSRSILPLEDLVITVLPSPWLDTLVREYRLENLRRLVLSQADDSKYSLHIGTHDALKVDYMGEHRVMATLLGVSKGSLEELYIYLPHYDPCSRPDQNEDNRHTPSFDLSGHANLKLVMKRMIWPSPDVKSPAGWLLKEATPLGLDPTYASLGETASTIQSEACKVILEFLWREDPYPYFKIGDAFGTIDAAFAENPSLSLLVRHNIFCAEIFELADAKEDMDKRMHRAFPMLRGQGRFNAWSSKFREVIPVFEGFHTCSNGHCRELFQEREWQEPEGCDDDDGDDYGLFSCRITL